MLQAEQFGWELRFHSDWQNVNFVLEGLRHGFHLGFSPSQKFKSVKKNKPSAAQHPCVVNAVSLSRVVVLSVLFPTRVFMLAAPGLFPKEANQGSGTPLWTFPPQAEPVSMMGLIRMNSPNEFSLHYIAIDQVICLVSKLGVGALMAKFDVETAYRNGPAHLSHSVFLGMKKRDQFYMDLILPLTFDQLLLFSTPLQIWWSGSLSIPTRFHTSSITWTTSLLQVPLSPFSEYRTWLLLWMSVNCLVYLCFLASVWALLSCLLFWVLNSTLSTKWQVFCRRSC